MADDALKPARDAQQSQVLSPLDDQPSRTDRVVESLTLAILRGEMQPGDRLVERDIAEALSVSKTPVREALMILVQRGLAVTNTYRGAEVFAADVEFARELYRVRLLLEPVAVFEAVPHQTEATIGLAHAALEDAAVAAQSGDLAELSITNRRFHRALYAPGPNRILRAMTDDLQDRVALVTVAGWRRRSSWTQELDEHRVILNAVSSGAAEDARERVEAHITKFLRQIG